MNKLIVVTGQTATGKTSLALKYARELDGELVNADSRHIYKKLDIITGKDLEVLKSSKIPLYLFDIADPKEKFSSFDYVQKAHTAIGDIVSRKKTPIIVGGTFFYIQHLLYGHDTEGIGADQELREKLNQKTVPQLQSTLLHLFEKMKQQNTMNQSDWNNTRRLIRKIEILSSEDNAMTRQRGSPLMKQFDIEMVGLHFAERNGLVNTVTKRVHTRLQEGAIEEVKSLLKQGYTSADPGLKTIGYKQLISYLTGICTKEEAIAEWITREVQYAKRQYTFMKKDATIKWLEVR